MMQKFARRGFSQLIKAEASTKPVAAPSSFTLLQANEYGEKAMTEFFEQDALVISAEEIAEKAEQRDFNFFLAQSNFLKVTDSLEKFERDLVDLDTKSGKDFVQFKTKLYQMYEVKNRSVYEHQAYTMQMDRQSLDSLYGVTQNFVHESAMVDRLDQLCDTGALQGKVFKAKMMTPERLQGVVSLTASLVAFKKMTMLSLMLGPVPTVAGIVGCAVYGLGKFNQRDIISAVELKDGKVHLTIQKSPVVSFTATVDADKICSLCTYEANEHSDRHDDEAHLVEVRNFEAEGETHAYGIFRLPADGLRDSVMMDWILARKGEHETTFDDFNDLMTQKFDERVANGGLNPVAAYEARSTGFAKYLDGEDRKVEFIKAGDEQQLLNLKEFASSHGIAKLEELKPEELYEMYQAHQAKASK